MLINLRHQRPPFITAIFLKLTMAQRLSCRPANTEKTRIIEVTVEQVAKLLQYTLFHLSAKCHSTQRIRTMKPFIMQLIPFSAYLISLLLLLILTGIVSSSFVFSLFLTVDRSLKSLPSIALSTSCNYPAPNLLLLRLSVGVMAKSLFFLLFVSLYRSHISFPVSCIMFNFTHIISLTH